MEVQGVCEEDSMLSRKKCYCYVLGLFLITIILLIVTSCQSSKQRPNYNGLGIAPPNAREEFPCWFYYPSGSGTVGSLGISRNMAISHPPEFYARKYALQGLYDYLGWSDITESSMSASVKELLEGEREKMRKKGKTIHVPDIHESSGYVYAYAAYGPSSNSNNKLSPCPADNSIDPDSCKPEWLCSPHTENEGGVVGVSFRASKPQRQYNLAIKNGLTLLEYSYGVKVAGKDVVRKGKFSGTGNISINYSTLGVKEFTGQREEQIKIYVRQLRHAQDTLYLWLCSPELPPYSSASDLAWLDNPGAHDMKGGVGQCGEVPSGFLSDKIDVAARRAMKDLVRRYGDSMVISEEEVSKSTYRSYYYNGIETKYDSRLLPRLRGFYVDQNKVAYVWVVLKEPIN